MCHLNLHLEWDTASVIQKKGKMGKKRHRNMGTVPQQWESREKLGLWSLAQSHTCQASSLLGHNRSSASFHWDAAVSHLNSKQAFTALGKGKHAVAQAPHPGWQQVLLLQRAVAQPSLKFSAEVLQGGSPKEFHSLGLLRKKQKKAMPSPPG